MTGLSLNKAEALNFRWRNSNQKEFAFFFHYNKPASQREGKQQISVHFMRQCHIVDNIQCEVPTRGRMKKTQPRFVMAGKAREVIITENNNAIIR